MLLFMIVLLPSCGNDGPEFIIKSYDVRLDKPHQINVLFQVMTTEGEGVPDLKIDDFIIKEDNNKIGLEADAKLAPYRNINISVQTFLLIDNSKSMGNKLADLKEAATALIDQSPTYQSYAVYVFSSSLELLQPLTNNKDLLKKKISSIKIGTSSTNLYGALRDLGKVVRLYPEVQTLETIKVTSMICFSDGDDTRGTVKASEAIGSLKGLNAYLIGTGEDLNASVLSHLGAYYPLKSIKKLKNIFLNIQDKIQHRASSYYWLLYQSPKRGDFVRTLIISLYDEPNTNIKIKFNSKNFID